MGNNDFSNEINKPGQKLLGGAHLVEASAGTGKTHSIQDIFARLIMEKDFRVSKTLVVTFTEAATKELRERLHAVLKDLQTYFDKGTCLPNDDIKDTEKRQKDVDKRNKRAKSLKDCVPEAKLEQAKENVEKALSEFDNAAISTIHGFCQRVLTRYAFETGFPFGQEVENNESELDRLAVDWWRKNNHELDLSDLKKFVKKLHGKGSAPSEGVRTPDEADYVIEENCGELLTAAVAVVNEYEDARRTRDKLNFDDLLRGLRDALKGEQGKNLATTLRKEFQAAIVDEYQDTDPVQNEIFRRIFLEGDISSTPVYFVGDPKQAIYAFRGGDVYSYLNTAKDKRLKGHGLAVNHRSTPQLVEAVNGIFEGTNTFGVDGISYKKVAPDEELDDFKGNVIDNPFSIIQFTPIVTEKGISSVANMPTIFDILCDQIREILNEPSPKSNCKAYLPQDIAILMNAKTHMVALQQKLFEIGVPSVIQKPGNVFTSPIASELLAFLCAIVEPANDELLNAGLATVFGREDDGNIPSVDTQDAKAKQIERFRQWERLWRREGFAAFVAELGKNNYQVRLALRSQRELSDISQILELCMTVQSKIGHIPDSLISWLTDRINNAGESEKEKEEFQRELETDDNAVKIMTIHNSKGLQFPIVFLPDCWSVNSTSDRRNQFGGLFYYHNEQNKLVFSTESAKDKAEKEQKLEKVRLLYVAMTRAKERTILITPSIDALKNSKREPLGDLLSKLDRTQPNSPYKWVKWEQKEPNQATNKPEWEPEKHALKGKTFSTLPIKGSYSSMSPSHQEDMDLFDDDEKAKEDEKTEGGDKYETPADLEVHPIFLLPGGTTIGTCWHNILEKLPFNADDKTILQLSEQELLDSGFNPEQTYGKDYPETMLSITVLMLKKTLDYTMVSPTNEPFSLKMIDWNHRLSEQEFEFSTHNNQKTLRNLAEIICSHWETESSNLEEGKQDKALFINALKEWKKDDQVVAKDKKRQKRIPSGYLKGFMDLVFMHNDFYYIIDWKSNPISGDLDNFKIGGIRKEMAKHWYFLQYLIYASVLHNYLKNTLEGYSWEKNFGGIRYCFLRGIAADGEAPVFDDRPSEALLEAIAKELGLEA